MKKMLAPSILSADFMNLEPAIRMLKTAGADLIHCDVMDGHFVPNLTFGPPLIRQIRKLTGLPLDVHLMITNAEDTMDQYIDAGADWLSIHAEAVRDPRKALERIRNRKVRAGIVIKPKTSVAAIRELLPFCDYVLVMSVEPGFGGQSYLASADDKIRELAAWKREERLDYLIEVDGGINPENIAAVSERGAEVFVAGSAVFHAQDPAGTIKIMKDLMNAKG
ncbi:MAG: ribulose-phosphate 3-epimerase [Candidatus Marinimicrobia bacterium]|nr:ribulose-phosphate 3-epimerase [Candidatus Neomarinimicrobiota bacterium]